MTGPAMPAPPASLPRFAGAVLSGGSSRRMGSDKSTVVVGGRPLAAVAARALRAAGGDPVFAVGGNAGSLAGVGLVAVPDDHPGSGPLGGVLSALGHSEAEIVVVLACDLPWAAPGPVRQVVAALVDAPTADWAAPEVDGRVQPLHAAWRRRARPSLRAAFERGERSIQAAMGQVAGVVVHGLEPAALADVDEPDELLRARLVVRTPHRPDWRAMSDAKPEVDVARLAELHAEGAWVLDVRQPDEFEAGHVPGARLIPLGELATRHREVPTDQDVYVVCASGGRSAAATEALNGAGYRAFNVAGGVRDWIDAGHPVVTGPGPS